MPYERLRASPTSILFDPFDTHGPQRSERREQRFLMVLSVVICGFSVSGRLFSELTPYPQC